jgi:hypothetical protein
MISVWDFSLSNRAFLPEVQVEPRSGSRPFGPADLSQLLGGGELRRPTKFAFDPDSWSPVVTGDR